MSQFIEIGPRHCRPGDAAFCEDELILELGGGTGMVTRALLKRGVDPGKLMVVEQDRLLAQHLKNLFPKVAVIHGNAIKLCQLCNRYGRHVGTVVSSLPLLSLPPVTVEALGGALQKMLARVEVFRARS